MTIPRAAAFARAWWREITLRRAGVVAAICIALATQILFQTGILDDYALEDTFGAFAEYVGEALLIGFSAMLCVLAVDALAVPEGLRRNLALAVAVIIGVTAGFGAGLLARYASGPYPNAPYLVGEMLRWILLAGLLALIHEAQRRQRAAARALHEVEVGRIALEKRRMEARLQMMQAQIEPHFLFNTLATVKRLYRTDTADGEHMLASLMQYLRAALPKLREDESTLGDELDLIGAYLEILRIRMGERLRYSMLVPEQARAVPFPSMMLITLVENAIKHGITPRMEGGSIQVRVEIGESLQVEVADTGVGFRASSGSGIGLANIRARLAAMFGDRAELALVENMPCGVIARIMAPLRVPA